MSTIRKKTIMRKVVSVLLVMSLLLGLLPFQEASVVKAAALDQQVFVGNALIGNRTYDATNMFSNIKIDGESQLPGFKLDYNPEHVSSGNVDLSMLPGGTIALRKDRWIEVTINVGENPTLRQLAESGHARVELGWEDIIWVEKGGGNYQGIELTMQVLTKVGTDEEEEVGRMHRRAWDYGYHTPVREEFALTTDTVIKIRVMGLRDYIHDMYSRVVGMFVHFKDEVAPVLNSYSFTGNGLQRVNENTTPPNQQELYVKENETIDLTYRFSEAVRPTVLPQLSDPYLNHPLFANTSGTGLPAAGYTQFLVNRQYEATAESLARYHRNITYGYTGIKYHQSSNLPLEPGIIAPKPNNPGEALYDKFVEAEYVDAAGNAAIITPFSSLVADNNSDPYLRGKGISDPFDYENGGFRIIVDAVRPKYDPNANGIQPEILTGVTLNDNDTIDFTVQFSEEVIPFRDHVTRWEPEDVYLLFNNGMTAEYVSGYGTDKWLFRTVLTDDLALETPLLKVIALAHKEKPSDTLVLQDYAGNLLMQPANYKGVFPGEDDVDHPEYEDPSLMDSTIDWANLMIDNTKPNIAFRFETGGATADTYRTNGKITIDAEDPDIIVPQLDPQNPGSYLPSRGIYRPSNNTGSEAPAVGLVYYVWSQSPNNPFAGKEDDRYAALKRYSLTGIQPGEDLYPGEYEDMRLAVVNNKTNMIAPPAEALLPENSGIWYMHAWTADMTWDSARELMQYEKMKQFISTPEGELQYEAWKAEHSGSESDKTFYADGKAMAAVGNYADWDLEDFKQADSNWSYGYTPFLLDNEAPEVLFTDIAGNATAEATIAVNLTDPHSGLGSAYFQFVAAGAEPSGAAWRSTSPNASGDTVITTLNNVFEDGEYVLYIQAADQAGNQLVTRLEEPIVVDSSSTVRVAFQPESNASYVRTHDVEFYISGIEPANVSYAITSSIARPVDAGVYTTVTSSTYREAGDPDMVTAPLSGGEYMYNIAMDPALNGITYLHMLVDPGDGSRIYTYAKAYYFDNEAPIVGFSRTAVPYPQLTHEVTVTVAEEAGRADVLIRRYQWVKDGDQAPDAISPNWNDLPENGVVSIDAREVLDAGETANYRLYVYAEDAAGNGDIYFTGLFAVSLPDAGNPAAGESTLIHLFGDSLDGYTGIVHLDLATPDKRGYEYSISSNGGLNWSRWQPYTNFIATALPTNRLESLDIQVKFRRNGGASGEAMPLLIGELSVVEPIYALAKLDNTRPVTSETGVNIVITPPLGIRVKAAEDNPPSGLEQQGNRFTVRENGYYAFDLTDLANPNRSEKLYVVVNNVDDTPPAGSIYYMSTLPTNGNAVVKLESNEPIVVLQLEVLNPTTLEPIETLSDYRRNTYTFTRNGAVRFTFADEAGNEATEIAAVTHIDKEAPSVHIVDTYAYGTGTDDVFGTIRDGDGNVLAASGVVLTAEKTDPAGKDFTIAGDANSIIVRRNGTYSFVARDSFGNTTTVSKTVSNIIETGPQPDHIAYEFVDAEGVLLPPDQIKTINGKQYARGNMRLTITGKTNPANIVFNGTLPSRGESGEYTNRISDEEGNYEISRIVEGNGSIVVALTDLVGNKSKLTANVTGLDNTAPEITLRHGIAGIVQNKANFDAKADLGGFIVSDNVSDPDNIEVEISGLDLSRLGRQTVTYTATDEVGNKAYATQDVYVVSGEDLLIFANGLLISSSLGETALFDTNRLTFEISGFDRMAVGGVDMINERGTYDVMYQSGLFREGQMKYIASRLTYGELVSNGFTVTFPQAGWYTIIVRTQEREREFATFFVGSVK